MPTNEFEGWTLITDQEWEEVKTGTFKLPKSPTTKLKPKPIKSIDNTNKLKDICKNKNEPYGLKFNKEQLEWHLKNLYGDYDPNKFIFVAYAPSDESDFKHWAIRIKDLFDNSLLDRIIKLSQTNHVWFSQACFYKPHRRIESLYTTSSVIIDLDYYKSPLWASESVSEVIEAINDIVPLRPSYYINSGRGLSAVYLIDNLALNKQSIIIVRNKLVNAVVELLTPFGADNNAKDLTRVNRPPNVVNHRNKAKTYIVDFDTMKDPVKYSFNTVCDAFLPHTLQEVRDFKDKLSKPPKIASKRLTVASRNFRYDRCKDLQKLIYLRHGNVKGFRNTLCHLYALYWHKMNRSKSINDCLNATMTFASTFKEKLDNASIEASVRKIFETNYKYKTITIINKLEITEVEMQHLHTLVSTEIRKKRKNSKDSLLNKQKRREAHGGLTAREAIKLSNMKNIASLLDKGMKQKDICTELGLSKGYVSKVVKELKSINTKERNIS